MYGLDDPGFHLRQGKENFLFSKMPKPALQQTGSPIFNEFRVSFFGIYRAHHDVDYLLPSDVEYHS
jgi:hypothetical protein